MAAEYFHFIPHYMYVFLNLHSKLECQWLIIFMVSANRSVNSKIGNHWMTLQDLWTLFFSSSLLSVMAISVSSGPNSWLQFKRSPVLIYHNLLITSQFSWSSFSRIVRNGWNNQIIEVKFATHFERKFCQRKSLRFEPAPQPT